MLIAIPWLVIFNKSLLFKKKIAIPHYQKLGAFVLDFLK
jgi:hypothetical protein